MWKVQGHWVCEEGGKKDISATGVQGKGRKKKKNLKTKALTSRKFDLQRKEGEGEDGVGATASEVGA